jgi:uncharacterized protein (TIGR04255 family)
MKIQRNFEDFQDKVRGRFPVYEQRTIQEVTFSIGNREGAAVRTDQLHVFKDESSDLSLALGTGGLTLEAKSHSSGAVLRDDMRLALDALTGVYGVVAPVRLGLRYVNMVNRGRISTDLKRAVDWKELIHGDFLLPVGEHASLAGTTFYTETTTSLERGSMTVRHGLVSAPGQAEVMFLFDSDRFIVGSFELGETLDLFEAFRMDTFSIFLGVAGPALREWMQGGNGDV